MYTSPTLDYKTEKWGLMVTGQRAVDSGKVDPSTGKQVPLAATAFDRSCRQQMRA